MPFFRCIKREIFPEVDVDGLEAEIQKVLLKPEFSKLPELVSGRRQIISRVMEIARARNDTILYADCDGAYLFNQTDSKKEALNYIG